MPRLYRSANDLEHWYVYLDGAGWLRFPAKPQGWQERRSVCGLHALALREVPLWLAFHTGLLEEEGRRTLHQAA